jgi:RNA polymerase sigma-70 factor (sigma-E family)
VEEGRAGFEEWARSRSPGLLRAAWLLTGDRHAAEDLVQDALVRVADRWERVSRDGHPDAYVRTVLHRLSIDRWRRARARVAEVLTDRSPEPRSGAPDGRDQRLLLEEALGRLTPRQRAVLVLRFYDDLTETATATVLRCSASTVKSQTRVALERLRVLAPDLLDELREEAGR